MKREVELAKRLLESKGYEVSQKDHMLFANDTEANEYAEDHGLKISKMQDTQDGCLVWFTREDLGENEED